MIYKINELASMFGLTTPTLRFYEKEGLLIPTFKDPQNGYRYYTDDSVNILSQIIQLKFLGFELKQIKNYFNNSYSKDDKIAELKRIIEISNNQIINLENALETKKNFEVTIKEIPSFHAVYSECICDTSTQVLKEYGLLFRKTIKNKLIIHFPICFILTFSDLKNNASNLLLLLEVDTKKEGITRFFHAQTMATLMYRGKHSEISYAYQTLQNYLDTHNLHACGNYCEKYFGPLNPVTDDCIVELRVPICRK